MKKAAWIVAVKWRESNLIHDCSRSYRYPEILWQHASYRIEWPRRQSEILMPVHDWTLVEDGIFHGFHTWWIGQIGSALNSGLLPRDYYAMPEQHTGQAI